MKHLLLLVVVRTCSVAKEEMLGDGYAAAERIALEPNGNPNYLLLANQRALPS